MQEHARGLGGCGSCSGNLGGAGESQAGQGRARSEHGPPARAARLRDSHARTVMHQCRARVVMIAGLARIRRSFT